MKNLFILLFLIAACKKEPQQQKPLEEKHWADIRKNKMVDSATKYQSQ